MDIKEFVVSQITSLENNKAIDVARTEGFYEGASRALKTVLAKINELETKEQPIKEKQYKQNK